MEGVILAVLCFYGNLFQHVAVKIDHFHVYRSVALARAIYVEA